MTSDAPRIDPEELLANAAWVRALAKSLVGEADADDVAQRTMTLAVERGPRPGVPLGAWLARVARNLSFNVRRDARRRALREAAARPSSAAPSPEESVQRTEMFRDVVGAVLALEPIHRDVVVLRFFDDLEMTDVARRLGVPLETARTRLKRALAVLRARLDAEYGDRRAWAVVLLGPDAARSPWKATAATAAGGALVAKKLIAAAVLTALLLVGGWFVADAVGRRPSGALSTETAAAPSPSGARPAPRGRSAATETKQPAAPTPNADVEKTAAVEPSRWLVRGRLDKFEPDAAPAQVALYYWDEAMDASKPPQPIRAEASGDGRFEIDFTAARRAAFGKSGIVVIVDHPAFLPGRAEVHVRPGVVPDATGAAAFECVVEMRRAAVIDVEIVAADGRPLPGAHAAAFVFRENQPDESPVDSAVADAWGAARLRLPVGEKALVVGAAKNLYPAAVEATGGTTKDARLVLRAGVALGGRVTQGQRPLAGVELTVFHDDFHGRTLHVGDAPVHWDERALASEETHVVTDAEGRWRVAGLSRGGWRVRLEKLANGATPMGFEKHVAAPDDAVDFELAVGTLVVETRCDGKPLAKVRLFVAIGGSVPSATTDANGRAELLLAPGVPYSIQTELYGYRETHADGESPVSGAVETLPLTVAAMAKHGPIMILVKDEDGRPIERTGFAFFTKDGKPWEAQERFGDGQNGSIGFIFNDLDAGKYRLVVRPGRHWQPDWTWDGDAGTWLDETIEVEVLTADANQYEVKARRGGRLRIAARGTDGKILPAECVIRDPSGVVVKCYIATRYGQGGAHSMGEGSLGRDAPSDVAEALPAGRYRVTLSMDGRAEKTVDAELVAGKTCMLDVTLDAVAGPPPQVIRSGK